MNCGNANFLITFSNFSKWYYVRKEISYSSFIVCWLVKVERARTNGKDKNMAVTYICYIC